MLQPTLSRKLTLAVIASMLTLFLGMSSGYAQQQPVTGTLETEGSTASGSVESPPPPPDSVAAESGAASATMPPPPPPAAAPTPTTVPAQPIAVQPAPVATPPAPAPLPVAEPLPAPQAADAENTDGDDDNDRINMDGRTGFAVGLSGGSSTTPLTVGTSLGLRSWLGDAVALQPRLQMDFSYDDQSEIFGYGVTPAIGLLFAVYRGQSTRVNFGFGFEFGFYGKKDNGGSDSGDSIFDSSSDDSSSSDFNDSSSALHRYSAYDNENVHSVAIDEVTPGYKIFYLGLPLELQIEHFFSDRFAGFVGAKFPLVSFMQVKDDEGESDPVNFFSFSLDSTSLVMGVIFYTD